jgi:hypothetical protein
VGFQGSRGSVLYAVSRPAATVLAILAVPTPTAMATIGWPSAEMAARYQHVLDSIRLGVADQIGGCCGTEPGPIWPTTTGGTMKVGLPGHSFRSN